jgi:hypothetical protein
MFIAQRDTDELEAGGILACVGLLPRARCVRIGCYLHTQPILPPAFLTLFPASLTAAFAGKNTLRRWWGR